jgi:hypothetical protein
LDLYLSFYECTEHKDFAFSREKMWHFIKIIVMPANSMKYPMPKKISGLCCDGNAVCTYIIGNGHVDVAFSLSTKNLGYALG